MNMKKINYKTYIILILITLLGGALTGLIISPGVDAYKETVIKPPLTPPAIVFPIMWSILYVLMAISAGMVKNSCDDKDVLFIYWIQLFVNYFWSFIFFGFNKYLFAFIWLLLLLCLIIAMTVSFYKRNKKAAYIQIPYILWVAFAGYLNFGVFLLN